MAPLPVIPDVVRCSFNWTSTEYPRHAVNVMHFSVLTYNISALMTSLEASVTTQMWSHTPSTSKITSIKFTPLDGSAASVDIATSGGSKWSGNGTPGTTVPQVSAIVKLLTAQRGRSHRGRIFLPWVGEGDMNAGILSTTEVTALQSAWTAFIAAMSTSVKPMVVASYTLSTASVVTSVLAETQLATQRRRQPRPA
jgi:hypothetical protein